MTPLSHPPLVGHSLSSVAPVSPHGYFASSNPLVAARLSTAVAAAEALASSRRAPIVLTSRRSVLPAARRPVLVLGEPSRAGSGNEGLAMVNPAFRRAPAAMPELDPVNSSSASSGSGSAPINSMNPLVFALAGVARTGGRTGGATRGDGLRALPPAL
jgi:hypothetical protein